MEPHAERMLFCRAASPCTASFRCRRLVTLLSRSKLACSIIAQVVQRLVAPGVIKVHARLSLVLPFADLVIAGLVNRGLATIAAEKVQGWKS